MTQTQAQERAAQYARHSGQVYSVWTRPEDGAWCILQGTHLRRPGQEPPGLTGEWWGIA